MVEIRSSSSPDSPKPWFEFTVMNGLKVRFNAANGLGKFAEGDASDLAHLLGVRKLALSSEKPEERHVLAVDLEGDVDFVPVSEQRATYYAHLAWYEPQSDEWEVLEFRE